MALPRKKPTVAAAPAKATPQFRVVGKDEPKPSTGLNFGALAKPTAKKSAPAHPTLALEGEGLALLGQYAAAAEKFKPLEKLVGPKGSIKAQLRPHLVERFFLHFSGRPLDESRCLTTTKSGREVKLTFKEQYSKLCTDLATILKAVPKAEPHVALANTLKIEFDKIPVDKQQPFVDAIIAAAQELEISEGITASQCVQPKPGFHAQRTTILTPEENLAFDAIIPITAYPQL